ncbi:MAG: hypothetical protein E7377_02105 [Clostridiales bacterium]|nr:hypothetical protein [Clostridiales bacterium]
MKMKSVLSMMMALATCASVAMFSSCNIFQNSGSNSENSSNSEGGDVKAAAYVNLDINPEVELTIDTENKVVSVYGGNEDGLVLLYEETGIVGADVEDAVEKIIDLAVEMGYLDEENKVVGTSVVSTDGKENDLLSKINTEITATAQELGLAVTTDAEGAYSVLRDLEELKAAYPNSSAIQNVSVSKFQLAASAAETGEVTLKAAVEMDTEELVEMVSTSHEKMEEFATEAFKQAKTLANATYDKALGMAKAGVYMQYATTKKPTLLPYGGAYFMYKASACGFEAIADSLMYVEKLQNYELNDTQVELVMEALQLKTDKLSAEEVEANKELLKDADGKITVASVEAYADKLFKNSVTGAKIEEMKTALDEALTNAETLLKAEVTKAKETYGPQIEAIIQSAEVGLMPLKGMSALLPPVIQQAVADFETVAADVRTAINEDTFNEAQLRVLAKDMSEKAESLLVEAQNQLNDTEKAEINAEVDKIVARFEEDRIAMNAAIDQAETDAKARLEELKNARKTA